MRLGDGVESRGWEVCRVVRCGRLQDDGNRKEIGRKFYWQ
jgi:hypothetical protein